MLPPYLSAPDLNAILQNALDEDVGPGDVTTEATIPADRRATARIVAKEAGVVAGLAAAEQVFRLVSEAASVDWACEDGTSVDAGTVVGRLSGRAAALLTGERLALNLLQRMSGIATATCRMVEAVRPHDTDVLDTRKTAPGLRLLDKWAVRLGGGTNHRIGLYDLILIKDNHIAATGGIAEALDAALAYRASHDSNLKIEMETRTLDEVRTACDHGGADILLLDNMVSVDASGTVDTVPLERAVALINGRARTEASGNVTLATAPAIAATGVDALSSGALTHSVAAVDLSMQMTLQDR